MPEDALAGFDAIERDEDSMGLPAKQGLYDPENEKDSCGVGFVCHIKGKGNHKIVSDARSLLCNMTHRGASKFQPMPRDMVSPIVSPPVIGGGGGAKIDETVTDRP
jgi:glutamate synthase (NADPH/NADH)